MKIDKYPIRTTLFSQNVLNGTVAGSFEKCGMAQLLETVDG